jgi:hypothetical protein
MPIQLFCTNCGRKYTVADSHGGKRFKCKNCETILMVPAPESTKPAQKAKPKITTTPSSKTRHGLPDPLVDLDDFAEIIEHSEKKAEESKFSLTESDFSPDHPKALKGVLDIAGIYVAALAKYPTPQDALVDIGKNISNKLSGAQKSLNTKSQDRPLFILGVILYLSCAGIGLLAAATGSDSTMGDRIGMGLGSLVFGLIGFAPYAYYKYNRSMNFIKPLKMTYYLDSLNQHTLDWLKVISDKIAGDFLDSSSKTAAKLNSTLKSAQNEIAKCESTLAGNASSAIEELRQISDAALSEAQTAKKNLEEEAYSYAYDRVQKSAERCVYFASYPTRFLTANRGLFEKIQVAQTLIEQTSSDMAKLSSQVGEFKENAPEFVDQSKYIDTLPMLPVVRKHESPEVSIYEAEVADRVLKAKDICQEVWDGGNRIPACTQIWETRRTQNVLKEGFSLLSGKLDNVVWSIQSLESSMVFSMQNLGDRIEMSDELTRGEISATGDKIIRKMEGK